jgi:Tol biopolymer transport system component
MYQERTFARRRLDRFVRTFSLVFFGIGASLLAVAQAPLPSSGPAVLDPLAGEKHLANIRQLTFGGENAEAYFSFDGRQLIFQSTRDAAQCDQQYVMNVDGSNLHRISNGQGRTTCGYFYPDGRHVLYASTHLGGTSCPQKPDFSRGYVWPLYPTYDIFRVRADGSEPTRLTTTAGYDAEATIGRDGRVVFTSLRDGDMELYSMNGDGSDVKRLTASPGADGGAFFSSDGRQIVWRGKHITDAKELDDYRALLKQGLWRPMDLEIFVMNRDGSGKRQVTDSGGSNFAPFFFPDAQRIIFASNMNDPRGRNFDLYLVKLDGSGLEQVTFNDTFDGFPMFSPDGRQIVFASNRRGRVQGETNVFIADWVE